MPSSGDALITIRVEITPCFELLRSLKTWASSVPATKNIARLNANMKAGMDCTIQSVQESLDAFVFTGKTSSVDLKWTGEDDNDDRLVDFYRDHVPDLVEYCLELKGRDYPPELNRQLSSYCLRSQSTPENCEIDLTWRPRWQWLEMCTTKWFDNVIVSQVQQQRYKFSNIAREAEWQCRMFVHQLSQYEGAEVDCIPCQQQDPVFPSRTVLPTRLLNKFPTTERTRISEVHRANRVRLTRTKGEIVRTFKLEWDQFNLFWGSRSTHHRPTDAQLHYAMSRLAENAKKDFGTILATAAPPLPDKSASRSFTEQNWLDYRWYMFVHNPSKFELSNWTGIDWSTKGLIRTDDVDIIIARDAEEPSEGSTSDFVEDGPLHTGDVGLLIEDDGSKIPYLVEFEGDVGWYPAEALVPKLTTSSLTVGTEVKLSPAFPNEKPLPVTFGNVAKVFSARLVSEPVSMIAGGFLELPENFRRLGGAVQTALQPKPSLRESYDSFKEYQNTLEALHECAVQFAHMYVAWYHMANTPLKSSELDGAAKYGHTSTGKWFWGLMQEMGEEVHTPEVSAAIMAHDEEKRVHTLSLQLPIPTVDRSGSLGYYLKDLPLSSGYERRLSGWIVSKGLAKDDSNVLVTLNCKAQLLSGMAEIVVESVSQFPLNFTTLKDETTVVSKRQAAQSRFRFEVHNEDVQDALGCMFHNAVDGTARGLRAPCFHRWLPRVLPGKPSGLRSSVVFKADTIMYPDAGAGDNLSHRCVQVFAPMERNATRICQLKVSLGHGEVVAMCAGPATEDIHLLLVHVSSESFVKLPDNAYNYEWAGEEAEAADHWRVVIVERTNTHLCVYGYEVSKLPTVCETIREAAHVVDIKLINNEGGLIAAKRLGNSTRGPETSEQPSIEYEENCFREEALGTLSSRPGCAFVRKENGEIGVLKEIASFASSPYTMIPSDASAMSSSLSALVSASPEQIAKDILLPICIVNTDTPVEEDLPRWRQGFLGTFPKYEEYNSVPEFDFSVDPAYVFIVKNSEQDETSMQYETAQVHLYEPLSIEMAPEIEGCFIGHNLLALEEAAEQKSAAKSETPAREVHNINGEYQKSAVKYDGNPVYRRGNYVIATVKPSEPGGVDDELQVLFIPSAALLTPAILQEQIRDARGLIAFKNLTSENWFAFNSEGSSKDEFKRMENAARVQIASLPSVDTFGGAKVTVTYSRVNSEHVRLSIYPEVIASAKVTKFDTDQEALDYILSHRKDGTPGHFVLGQTANYCFSNDYGPNGKWVPSDGTKTRFQSEKYLPPVTGLKFECELPGSSTLKYDPQDKGASQLILEEGKCPRVRRTNLRTTTFELYLGGGGKTTEGAPAPL